MHEQAKKYVKGVRLIPAVYDGKIGKKETVLKGKEVLCVTVAYVRGENVRQRLIRGSQLLLSTSDGSKKMSVGGDRSMGRGSGPRKELRAGRGAKTPKHRILLQRPT